MPVRFTVSRHNSLGDVQELVENLVEVSADVAAPAFRRTTPPSVDGGAQQAETG